MIKKKLQNDLNLILNSLTLFPQGASLEEINQTLKFSISKRTLQRYIGLLIKQNSIQAFGKGVSRRYRLPPALEKKEIPKEEKERNLIIALSPTALDLQNWVNQPIQTRPHVSYNREFLDSYRPNNTEYLSQDVKKHLFELGKSPDGEQPAGTFARQIFDRLLIDLSWNSSRLEGNTYSLLETERLLELNEVVEGKDTKEAQMILNHKAAIEFLVESADYVGVNSFTILNLHALLSEDLLTDTAACGRLRSIPVGIGKSIYLPLAVPQLIRECFQQIIDTAAAIRDPFEQAFFLMVQLPYLQPFEDVNKRVSRLSANIPLIKQNLSPLSFVDVPETTYISALLAVYELNRIELMREVFIWAYERSCSLYSATRKTLGEPDPFRTRYRSLIKGVVTSIVCGCLDKKAAVATIKKYANESISSADQARFIELVENDLRGLHEGNIARFRIRPLEYKNWHKNW